MASPITFKNVTVPSLDTSNIGAAAGRITDSLGSIGTGIDSLSQGVQSNFAVRQANAARDIQRKIRQDQTANRANTLFGLKGLEDSDIARSLGLGVNKAGNLSFGETQSDAQLSTPENLARIEKAFGGARPDLVEQFGPPVKSEPFIQPDLSNIQDVPAFSDRYPLAGKEVFDDPANQSGHISPRRLRENAEITEQTQAKAAALEAAGITPDQFSRADEALALPTNKSGTLSRKQQANNDEILNQRRERDALVADIDISAEPKRGQPATSNIDPNPTPDERLQRGIEAAQSVENRELFDATAAREFQNIRGEREDLRQGLIQQAQAIRDAGGTLDSKGQQELFQRIIDNDPKLDNVSDEVIERNKTKLIKAEADRTTLTPVAQQQVEQLNEQTEKRHTAALEIAEREMQSFRDNNQTSTPISESDNVVATGEVLAEAQSVIPTDKVLGFLTDTPGDSAGADFYKRAEGMLDKGFTDSNGKNHKYSASMMKAAMQHVRVDTGFQDGYDFKQFNKVLDRFMTDFVNEAPIREAVKNKENDHTRNKLGLDEQLIRDRSGNISKVKNSQGQFRVGDAQIRQRPATAGPSPGDRFASEAAAANQGAALTSSSSPQEIQSSITAAATSYGVDPAIMLTIADLESEFDASAKNPTEGSTAEGVFQIIDSTFNNLGGGDKFDPATNIDAAMRLTVENRDKAEGLLGRPLEPSDYYLLHQQNPPTVMSMIGKPNDKAVDHVATRGAIANNVPNIKGESKAARKARIDSMTTTEFLDIWRTKFDARFKKYS